ncbi:lysosomal alpha-glucosidase-like [Amblyraja radiata]|uniref:lysosomal alpha-glucosidase-like n=1 Tax=Amblyraja radiata TaxID=386614 RepID=UPI001403B6F3|nr:lysosomal alpha-glucosidase-like [Amblyraja radiata]XP_032896706.1 lysosomal alpha-glucosidase-like [Amblyraja radiata]XP_032896707.1 lysosomal alpha-glucosidase-like [Amblyraja radiata]
MAGESLLECSHTVPAIVKMNQKITHCRCNVWVLIFIVILLGSTSIWHSGDTVRQLTSSEAGSLEPEVRIALPQNKHGSGDTCLSIPEQDRFDCYPERDRVVTRKLCEQRGCCFAQDINDSSGVPWCFYPPNFPSYILGNRTPTELGEAGELTRKNKTYYPRDILKLQLNVMFETDHRLHIKINDSSNPRYEVPIEVPRAAKKATSPLYTVEYSEDPFGIVVRRRSTGTVLLNTTVAPLFFADQFLQISTSLPSAYLYGLGEHRAAFLHSVQWNTLTFWARDTPPQESINLYGVHPFYLSLEPDGKSHGVFLLNSNAMDVALQPTPALTWRTIGGILDFYIFMGPDPNSVIQQYLEVIGLPSMVSAWGLGFHLCRWGYESSNATWEVVKQMRKAGMPQDAQWNDIDYMTGYRDFTFDPKNFASLPQLVADLHSHGQQYVMILDPGISSSQPPGSYWPYDEGLKREVFITDTSGSPLIGKVWPGLTAFPDFTNPDTHQWWFENLLQFHKAVPFDGLWIDMNEPSNFVEGSESGCPSNELENPPFVPGVLGGHLRSKTICASVKQKISTHYNVHSLYGLMEAKASASALMKIRKKRPFVISRSTFPSQGKYSGHWLGDNRSQWKDMYFSIPGILNFNMFGIPLVGADMCGFGGSTTEEMCVRWMQLGAFYPFSRNHNSQNEKAQDPTAFSESAQAAMKRALLTRYSLLPFLYTLFHHSHIWGETVARALFFEFPEDRNTYSIDRQFLWGRSLLITPVLEPGASSVTAYFPRGVWYDFYTGSPLVSTGEFIKLPAPLDTINLHLREGEIIVTQEPATTTWVSSGNPLHLLVALSQNTSAKGCLFWDDGESLDTYERNNYTCVEFTTDKNELTSKLLHVNVEATYIKVDTVSVFGVNFQPSKVIVNGSPVPFSHSSNQVLIVDKLHLPLEKEFYISWS